MAGKTGIAGTICREGTATVTVHGLIEGHRCEELGCLVVSDKTGVIYMYKRRHCKGH